MLNTLSPLLLALALAATPALAQAPKALGPRPERMKYAPLDFKPPKPADFRTTLSNGLVVYIAEDREIPWVNATLLTKHGPFLEPKDKLGVEGMTAAIMRSGGTTTMTETQINERMDFLAGTVSATGLSIHTRHLEEGLKIWMDILQNPAFPENKLRRMKEQALQGIRNRNKQVQGVAARVFNELIYGKESPITQQPTETGANGITREDLVAWHQKYWGAQNAILVISGDFSRADMLKKLEATLGTWKAGEKAVPVVPAVSQAAKAGVYMVQPEVVPNQGILRVGHLGLKQDDPDYPAVDLMNYILGGGSFSSRITKVVRADNGLAYTANSSFSGGLQFPGTFAAFCQTKNETVVFAAQLILDLIERMRAGEISEKDLQFAKTARVNAFPALFSTVQGNLSAFAQLELNNRPMDFYQTYLEKYQKVTLADLKRVAKTWLQPDKLVILVAGNVAECRAGAGTTLPNQSTIEAMAGKFGGRSIEGLAKKFGNGSVNVLPLH